MDVHIDKRTLYESLKAAIVSQKLSVRGVELLSPAQVRMAIGQGVRGLSVTFIRNMQRRLVAEMRREELQSAADWILSRILSQFANAGVAVKRNRIVQVWLDGLPEEIE